MCFFCRSASVLAVLCLISCSKPEAEEGLSSPSNSAVQKTAEIAVTGERMSRADTLNELPAYAPPPPPAPGIYAGQWTPQYHDVGRDKFTTIAENAFKIVR